MWAELRDLGRVLLLTRRAGLAQDFMAVPSLHVSIGDSYCSLSGVMLRKTMVVVTILLLSIQYQTERLQITLKLLVTPAQPQFSP